MSLSIHEVFELLRGLMPTAGLDAASKEAPPRAFPFKTNTHIHLPPNFSAFHDVSEAVEQAAAEGINVLGAGNYYDFDVYGEFGAACLSKGILPLFGLEVITLDADLERAGVKINDPGNPGKMYICGKGITRLDPLLPDASQTIDKIRQNDSDRMRRMIGLLSDIFTAAGVATPLDEEEIVDRVVGRTGAAPGTVTLQERHVAMAFQEALFACADGASRTAALKDLLGAEPSDSSDAVKVQNDIRTHLMKSGRPAFVAEKFVTFEEAFRLILQLGGIPCYPVLLDGAKPVCPFEDPVDKLIANVKSRGIHCVEFIPLRNDVAALERYVVAARKAGLVVTAGTEHNTLDMPPLTPLCRGGQAIPAAVEDILREGACIIAAHEVLTLSGRAGFVDENGSVYGGGQELIGRMARIGAAVVGRAARAGEPPVQGEI